MPPPKAATLTSAQIFPVHMSVRTELYDTRHAAWAAKHCALTVQYTQVEPGYAKPEMPLNYALLLGPDVKFGWEVLGYSCAEMPPWPREDQINVQKLYEGARKTPGYDRVRCAAPSVDARDYEVKKEGTGATAADDVFVRVRSQRYVRQSPSPLYPAERYTEPAITQVRHVNCFPFSGLLVALRQGGTGDFRQNSDVGDHWFHVELLEVGDEAMYQRELGVTGVPIAPKQAPAAPRTPTRSDED